MRPVRRAWGIAVKKEQATIELTDISFINNNQNWSCPACRELNEHFGKPLDGDRIYCDFCRKNFYAKVKEIPCFVVVEGAGGPNEWIVYSRVSAKDAQDCLESHYSTDERERLGVDVMKQNFDGTLTTEF